MKHLNDEQLDDILQDRAPEPDHLARCQSCRDRLAERRAVRARLRSAFASVRASEELAERIRRYVGQAATGGPPGVAPGPGRTIRLQRWLVPVTAAAAVFLMGAVALYLFTRPEPAMGAQAELAQIHRDGQSPHTELYSDADPKALAAHLKDRLGFSPAVPKLGAGMSLRGCCVAHFRDQPVGSYVVDTPRGAISVIVVTQAPESLGMKRTVRRGAHSYMAGSFARCNMVTSVLGGYTYCAVGEVPTDMLADLLEQLVW